MTNLQTDRLIVRNFRVGDADDLFAYLHRPTARCFLSLALPDRSAAEAEAAKRGGSDDYLAIVLKAEGRVIGDIFGMREQGDHGASAYTFGVGWNLNPHYGGQGYALEAARALFAHLFTDREARRLYAYVDEGNDASERLCERLGMRQEGLFREFISFANDANGDPIYENTRQYALLRKEWAGASEAA